MSYRPFNPPPGWRVVWAGEGMRRDLPARVRTLAIRDGLPLLYAAGPVKGRRDRAVLIVLIPEDYGRALARVLDSSPWRSLDLPALRALAWVTALLGRDAVRVLAEVDGALAQAALSAPCS